MPYVQPTVRPPSPGEILRQLLAKEKITQETLAKATKVSRLTVNQCTTKVLGGINETCA